MARLRRDSDIQYPLTIYSIFVLFCKISVATCSKFNVLSKIFSSGKPVSVFVIEKNKKRVKRPNRALFLFDNFYSDCFAHSLNRFRITHTHTQLRSAENTLKENILIIFPPVTRARKQLFIF